MELKPGAPLSKAHQDGVQKEALALMRFVVPDDDHDMHWTWALARR